MQQYDKSDFVVTTPLYIARVFPTSLVRLTLSVRAIINRCKQNRVAQNESPGVPVTMSMSPDKALACLLIGSPPRMVMLSTLGFVRLLCRLVSTAPVCSARSLLGSKMRAVGVLDPLGEEDDCSLAPTHPPCLACLNRHAAAHDNFLSQ